MTNAKQIVENLLDGDEGDSPEDIKSIAASVKSDEDARLAKMKAEGTVSPETVSQYGTIYHRTAKNSDGTAARAKVTSVKTWKTRPGEFEIGWKYGLREYGRITPHNASEWTTVEPPAVPRLRRRR